MVEVDRDDPGFANPTKFIGPVYAETDATRLKAEEGWTMKKGCKTTHQLNGRRDTLWPAVA
jgi:carbamate kinase